MNIVNNDIDCNIFGSISRFVVLKNRLLPGDIEQNNN